MTPIAIAIKANFVINLAAIVTVAIGTYVDINITACITAVIDFDIDVTFPITVSIDTEYTVHIGIAIHSAIAMKNLFVLDVLILFNPISIVFNVVAHYCFYKMSIVWTQ